jgi:hypothetical protein
VVKYAGVSAVIFVVCDGIFTLFMVEDLIVFTRRELTP